MLQNLILPLTMTIPSINIDFLKQMRRAGFAQFRTGEFCRADRIAPERDEGDVADELDVPIEG